MTGVVNNFAADTIVALCSALSFIMSYQFVQAQMTNAQTNSN